MHPGDGHGPPGGPRRPPRQGTRMRRYLAMMGGCLALIVPAWTLVWRYSVTAAVAMSAMALVIPPAAALVANAGAAGRR